MAGPHHRGQHPARSEQLRAAATPDTRCWRCGKTLDQHAPHRNGKPATWHADHVIDGDPLSPLVLSASTCNTQAGGALGATRRSYRPAAVTTRRW